MPPEARLTEHSPSVGRLTGGTNMEREAVPRVGVGESREACVHVNVNRRLKVMHVIFNSHHLSLSCKKSHSRLSAISESNLVFCENI